MSQSSQSTSAYAPINGLQMYYEIHGAEHEGTPLVLLHGAFSAIQLDFGEIIPRFATSRKVIAVEQQAHGHTADIDRPLSYEQMADDTAALLEHLGIEQADFYCYSFGGGVAMQIATRHPELVRKLALGGGTAYSFDGVYPELTAGLGSAQPEMFVGSPWYEYYQQNAPNPADFPTLVAKKNDLDLNYKGWTPEQIQAFTVPMLLMIGDSDIVRPEHTVEFFRLLGGGIPGDLTGLPKSQLAILPGTTHVTFVYQTDLLHRMITNFLNLP